MLLGHHCKNQKGIFEPKNLIQESKKESSLVSENFPVDLVTRWINFEKTGLGQKVKNEREIFEELFLIKCLTGFIEENAAGFTELFFLIVIVVPRLSNHLKNSFFIYSGLPFDKSNAL